MAEVVTVSSFERKGKRYVVDPPIVFDVTDAVGDNKDELIWDATCRDWPSLTYWGLTVHHQQSSLGRHVAWLYGQYAETTDPLTEAAAALGEWLRSRCREVK